MQTVKRVNLSDKLKSYWARTKAREPNSAKAPIEPAIVRKSHKSAALSDVGITVLWALIAWGIIAYITGVGR